MRGDAARINDAIEPPGQATTDGHQWTRPIHGTPIHRALSREVVGRGRDENIVARKCYGRTIRRVKASIVDRPGCSSIHADKEANRCRRDHEVRMGRVRAHLVHITVDVDGGVPRRSAIRRPRDAADVNVGEEHAPVRSCRHRAYAKRRANHLAVYEY